MPEPVLQELPGGKIKLGAEHFRKVVRRIEDIKPLAGEGVKIKPVEGGIEISVTSAGLNSLGSQFNGVPLGLVELTVCRNGEPSIIYVVGYDESENVEPEPD